MNLLDDIAWESSRVFAHPREFGEPGAFTPAGGVARTVFGVFDEVSSLTDIGALLAADGVAATYGVHAADFAEVAIGDALEIRGQTYRVVGREPDGTGRLTLVLGL